MRTKRSMLYVSHSRRGAKSRPTEGAANLPQPPKSDGAAAVGCKDCGWAGMCTVDPSLDTPKRKPAPQRGTEHFVVNHPTQRSVELASALRAETRHRSSA